jgi:hypothetical protein
MRNMSLEIQAKAYPVVIMMPTEKHNNEVNRKK